MIRYGDNFKAGEQMRQGDKYIMTKGIPEREVVEHQEGVLTLYSDGSFERCIDHYVPSSYGTLESGVATRDVVVDPDTGVWARIFRPKSTFSGMEPPEKVPIVLHFHGGGFCVGSPAAPHTHGFCRAMCLATRCLWVSVSYRLAPEHKLPAAYDDGVSAFRWLSETDDPWVSSIGDLGRVFVAGESAGGTMVHYVAGEIGSKAIAGLLLVHPAFPQERPAYDPASANLSNARVQFYHTSALPEGAQFGHPLMNPMHPESSIAIHDLPDVPVLVAAADGDPLLAGAAEYVETLRLFRDTGLPEASGSLAASVEYFESKGVGHCFHMFPENAPDESSALRGALASFISKHSYPN